MIEYNYPMWKECAITFSYDDGKIYDRRLVSLFNEYGLKGTFHLNSGTFQEDENINEDEVRALYTGHEVATHGVHHPYFTYLPKQELVSEILEDRKNLERLTGYPVRGMSYPFGCYSNEVCQTAHTLGIEYSRTVEDTMGFHLPADFMRWNPTCHHSRVTDEMIDQFLHPLCYMKMNLLYIWGHSFEFGRDGDWSIIENICKKVAHQDNVWYATNIEIKEYIESMRGLIYTVDEHMAYNPSAIDVYAKKDGKNICIPHGKTIEL
ncbi:polysaccharide deacetylase [Lachnospiraceae bacterium KM106-2]|nr:polysaccharide deacetylase [Lachnospiraceae bacterium KM106-2]